MTCEYFVSKFESYMWPICPNQTLPAKLSGVKQIKSAIFFKENKI